MNERWTKEEIELLVKYYPVLGARACAERLGRTVKAVQRKAEKLGLKRRNEIEEDQEKAALRREIRDLKRKYEQALLERDLTDRIIKRIERVITAFPPVTNPPPISSAPGEIVETAVLMLSDLHIGEVVSAEETFGLEEYNLDVFRRRLELLSKKIEEILFGCLKGYRFERFVIAALGDMVSGDIHEELSETNEVTIVEQAMMGAYMVAEFVRTQAAKFPVVDFYGVSGNHGRLSKAKRYKKRWADWDRILYETVRLLLRDQKNVRFHLSKSPFIVFEVNGARFLMEHGDNVRMWMQFPWYRLERERIRKKELVEAVEQMSFDYLLVGHFHQCGQIDTPRGEMLINGSFVGGSEYTIGELGRATRPTQLLFGVNREGLISFRFPLRLD